MAKKLYTDRRPTDGTGRYRPPAGSHGRQAPASHRPGSTGRSSEVPAVLRPIRTEPVLKRSR